MNRTTFRRTGAAVIAIVPAAVLLVFWPASLAAFAPYKSFALCALVAVATAAAAVGGPRRPPWTILAAWGAFVSLVAATGLVGLDPWRSIRGTYPRYESIAVLACVTALAWLLPALLDRRWLGRAIVVTFGATVVCGTYAVLQAVGLDPLNIVLGGRAWGTVGNPVLLGTALATLTPLPLALTLTGRGTRWMRRLAPVALAATATGVMVSQTRGAWLGLTVGCALAAVLVRRRAERTRTTMVGGVAVAVLAVILIVPSTRDTLISRASTIGVPGSSASARLLKYEVGLKMIARRPLTGFGWDSVAAGFPLNVPKDHMRRDPEGRITDRLHSEPLDVAVAAGLPGLAAWLALLVATTLCALPALKRGGTAAVLAGGLLGGMTAHLSAGLFVFPATSTWPILWATVGLLATVGLESTASERSATEPAGDLPAEPSTTSPGEASAGPAVGLSEAHPEPPEWWATALVAALGGIAVVGAVWATQDIVADQALFKAAVSPGVRQQILYSQAAVRFPDDAWVQLRAGAGLLSLGRTLNDPDVLVGAERVARDAARLRPSDVAYRQVLADVLLARALRGDRAPLAEARRMYGAALERAPYDTDLLKQAGLAEYALGTREGFEKALRLWSSAFEVDSNDADAAFNASLASEQLGRIAAAQEWIEIAYRLRPDSLEIENTRNRLTR